jgi:hypothetical protein
MASITISLDAPQTPFTGGYRVRYRKVGDTEYMLLAPNPTTTTITIPGVDGNYSYEGLIEGVCVVDNVYSFTSAQPFTVNANT